MRCATTSAQAMRLSSAEDPSQSALVSGQPAGEPGHQIALAQRLERLQRAAFLRAAESPSARYEE